VNKLTIGILAGIIGVAAGLGIGYAVFSSKDLSPPQTRTVDQPSFGQSPNKTITDSPSPESGPGASSQNTPDATPGRDPAVTMAFILEARMRGETEAIALWATPEATAQLSSYPPDAFDTARITCSPDSERPQSDVLCSLQPARVPIGQAIARLRQTGEGYRLISVVPVVD
jgi:hypothetical protein